MVTAVEILFSGFSTGTIYALVALGFVLIYKSAGILNFAQGELCMVGAFICFTFATMLEIPYFFSIVLAVALTCVLGAVIDLLLFRRLVGEPVHTTILVTIGLASILVSMTELIWGNNYFSIKSPFIGKAFRAGSLFFAQNAVVTICVSIILFSLFVVFFRKTLVGIALLGTAEDSHTAGLMGINVKRMRMLAWILGSFAAAIAGIFLAEQSFVHTGMAHIGFKAMSAAILGGMQSIGGAIIGGILVGIIESTAATFLTDLDIGNFHFGDVKDVTAFVIMILVLMIRPHGIFGKKEVERV